MLKVLLSVTLLIGFISLAFSAEDKKLVYTEEDFKNKVEEEVVKKLAKVLDKGVVGFSKDLLEKEKVIEKRGQDIQAREDEIKVIEEELKKSIQKFSNRQKKVLGCLSDNEKKINQRVQHMVDVISGMKADSAAQVLSVQDSSISVQILSKLEPEKISKIFNVMDKEISARLQKEYMNMKR